MMWIPPFVCQGPDCNVCLPQPSWHDSNQPSTDSGRGWYVLVLPVLSQRHCLGVISQVQAATGTSGNRFSKGLSGDRQKAAMSNCNLEAEFDISTPRNTGAKSEVGCKRVKTTDTTMWGVLSRRHQSTSLARPPSTAQYERLDAKRLDAALALSSELRKHLTRLMPVWPFLGWQLAFLGQPERSGRLPGEIHAYSLLGSEGIAGSSLPGVALLGQRNCAGYQKSMLFSVCLLEVAWLGSGQHAR